MKLPGEFLTRRLTPGAEEGRRGRAYPFLGLAETALGVAEDMVARTESFMTCLLDAAIEHVVDAAWFETTISVEGFKRLKPGFFFNW